MRVKLTKEMFMEKWYDDQAEKLLKKLGDVEPAGKHKGPATRQMKVEYINYRCEWATKMIRKQMHGN